MRSSPATSCLGLILILLALAGGSGHSQDSAPTEYQVKAAFLFNFAKFVDWPPQAFASRTSPLIIGILGENPFRSDLSRTIEGKKVEDHPVEIKEVRSALQGTNCHVLFISASEIRRLPEIFKLLDGTSVLTVGDTDGFTERGGMINFVLEGTKIRFQINKKAATEAGLRISSKLMSLSLNPRG